MEIRIGNTEKFRYFRNSFRIIGVISAGMRPESAGKESIQFLTGEPEHQNIQTILHRFSQIRKFRAGSNDQKSVLRNRIRFPGGNQKIFQQLPPFLIPRIPGRTPYGNLRTVETENQFFQHFLRFRITLRPSGEVEL